MPKDPVVEGRDKFTGASLERRMIAIPTALKSFNRFENEDKK